MATKRKKKLYAKGWLQFTTGTGAGGQSEYRWVRMSVNNHSKMHMTHLFGQSAMFFSPFGMVIVAGLNFCCNLINQWRNKSMFEQTITCPKAMHGKEISEDERIPPMSGLFFYLFRCILASPNEGWSVRPSVCLSVRLSVRPSVTKVLLLPIRFFWFFASS